MIFTQELIKHWGLLCGEATKGNIIYKDRQEPNTNSNKTRKKKVKPKSGLSAMAQKQSIKRQTAIVERAKFSTSQYISLKIFQKLNNFSKYKKRHNVKRTT